MRIEVDYGDRTVCTVDGAEEGKGNCMVAAKGDDSWESLAVLCWALFLRVCGGRAGEDAVVAFFNLLESPCVVVSIAYSQSLLLCIETLRLTKSLGYLHNPTQ